jgi:uncharacterized repeat protein (TIGR01451 family)
VRLCSSASRSPRSAIAWCIATAVCLAALTGGVAVADTVSTDFESFALGTVNGQGGWKSAPPGDHANVPANSPNGEYDQRVVADSGFSPAPPGAFGQRSLRMSNAYTSGEYTYQTYSTPVTAPAGEKQANTEYTAEFSFISTTPTARQPGLAMSVSPDSYEGSRMFWVSLTDTAAGIEVTASDTPEKDGEFVDYQVAVLDRSVPHTIRFWIKTNPGEDNDLVRMFIDNRDVGQCFTTWENYYRTASEQSPPPNRNTPATINSLQFRLGGASVPALAGAGFLFDNVTTTTANGPGPRGCDIDVDKDADTSTVTAGGLAGYQITVHNRGRTVARHIRACDRIPRHTTFVRAGRKLQRIGRRRCLSIASLAPGRSVGFHVTLRVNATAAESTLTNIADVTPITPEQAAAVLEELIQSAAAPGGLPGRPGAAKALKRAKARIRVLAEARRGPPRFTG